MEGIFTAVFGSGAEMNDCIITGRGQTREASLKEINGTSCHNKSNMWPHKKGFNTEVLTHFWLARVFLKTNSD